MGAMLTIGKVAAQATVNIQTIRYYERIGLVKPVAHRDSGYRLYTGEAVQRIRFIKHAQELGFSLKEIRELLRLRINKNVPCEEVRRRAEAHLEDVKEKIGHLLQMERVLEELIRKCQRRAPTDACPILRSLETDQANDERRK